ncbi:MAG: LysM peptidoglycan-binding domain-containing protein, partial [Abitibacteriaceae bacterium]|nr:LysM peptidoglycan-binding domain-containing protein [Abditibacteriaceae bacterium]
MKNTQPKFHTCKKHSNQKHSKLQQRKLKHWLMGSALLAATMPTAKCPVLIHVARADVYHAVEPGETLRSVANRYGLRPSALRAANKLDDTRDNAPLPAMLLRVPDGKKSDVEAGQEITPVKSAAEAMPEITSTGTISKTVRYTVQAGDTLDSIAHRYAQSGYPVTVEAIAEKNHLTPEPNIQPAIGSAIIIPLQSITYRASAQQSASRKAQSRPDNELTISGEVPVSMAQVVADKQPVYQSITKPPRTAAPRGYALGARGNMPVGGRDGVRVLKQNEDAMNTAPPPTSQPRVLQAPSSTTVGALAQVAQVSLAGAKIRRLPESDSYALYKCPVGTELAIIKQNGGWSAILMSDRSTGWIPTRYVKFTGASVDISSQVVTGSDAWAGRPSNDTV